MTPLTPKDAWTGMCGMIFQNGGVDHQINMFQLAICMIGASTLNPLVQLFG